MFSTTGIHETLASNALTWRRQKSGKAVYRMAVCPPFLVYASSLRCYSNLGNSLISKLRLVTRRKRTCDFSTQTFTNICDLFLEIGYVSIHILTTVQCPPGLQRIICAANHLLHDFRSQVVCGIDHTLRLRSIKL